MGISITDNNRLAWSLKEISEATGLSVNFLRYEVRRSNLKVKNFGTRILVRHEELQRYMETGSEGSKTVGVEAEHVRSS